MAREVHELAVALRAEGSEEVQDSLTETRESFEETAQTADKESSKLQSFATRWRSAMGAILGALGAATVGLLARIPVIKESVSGLDAVVGAWARTLDEELRPALGDANDDLFKLAARIDRADSRTKDLITSATILAGAGGLGAITLGPLIFKFAGLAAVASLSAGALLGVGFALGVVGGELTGVTDATGIAAVEMDTFAGAVADVGLLVGGPFLLILTTAAGFLKGGFKNAARVAQDTLVELMKAAARTAIRILGFFSELAVRGIEIIDVGFGGMVKQGKEWMNDLMESVGQDVNTILEQLSAIPGVDFGQIEIPQIQTRTMEEIRQAARERREQRIDAIRGFQQDLFSDGPLAPSEIQITPPGAARAGRAGREGITGQPFAAPRGEAQGEDVTETQRQLRRVLSALETGEQTVEVDVDGERIASATARYRGTGVETTGRSPTG